MLPRGCAKRRFPASPGKLTGLAFMFLVLGSTACVQDQPAEPLPQAGASGAGGAAGAPASCVDGVAEATASRCTDDCDNDGNGSADCEEANCCAVLPSCDPATHCGQQTDGNAWDGPLEFHDGDLQGIDPTKLPSGVQPCRPPVLVRVDYAIDGDTLDVTELGGAGESERVRVIGVNTPEIAHAGAGTTECYGDEATAFAVQLVDHLAWLTFDSECRDDYDRLLAYVFVGSGKNDWLERQLLRRGLGRAYPYGNNRTFQGLFASDEDNAKAADLGLWATCQ